MSDFLLLAGDYQVVFLISVGVYAENPHIISSDEAMLLLRGFGDYVMKPVGAHIPRAAGDFWREGSLFYRVLIRARLTRVLTSCFRINLKCQGLLSEYKQVQLQKEFLPCFCCFPDGYWKPNFHLKPIMPQSLEKYREEG